MRWRPFQQLFLHTRYSNLLLEFYIIPSPSNVDLDDVKLFSQYTRNSSGAQKIVTSHINNKIDRRNSKGLMGAMPIYNHDNR